MDSIGTARVVGLNTGGSHGAPFSAALVDLGALGFRQDEYLVEGAAASFAGAGELGFDGRWDTVVTTSAPFRTRIVVTIPTDPARFNGTVLVEWNNVSAGFDIMLADAPELFELGFAHVGVTTQYVGVHGHADQPMGLTSWDPDRYGTLTHPGDRYSYDIYAQCARLVGPDRPLGNDDPMNGLDVQQSIAIGGSQSAARLATFVNGVAPHRPEFDAIVLVTYFGSGSSLDTDAVLDVRAVDAGAQRLFPVGTQLRSDLGIPLMVVNSETEVMPYLPVRQPDTDEFRCWEVAGTAHATVPEMTTIVGKLMRDGIEMPTLPPVEGMPPMCAVAWKPVLIAALAHVENWITTATPPPSQPLIEITDDPPAIVRDRYGIALGGIRLPDVDAPLAAHTGVNGLGGMLILNGASVPFSADVLHERYHDCAGYLRRYDEAATRAVAAEVLLDTAVAPLRHTAEQAARLLLG